MSTSTQTQTEEVIAVSLNLKDKKKKRRSRKAKQNSPNRVSSSMCEIHVGEVNALEGGRNNAESDDHRRGSSVAFNSFPTMHITRETPNPQNGNLLSQQIFEAEYGREFSYSCPEPIVCKELVNSDTHGDPPAQAISSSVRRKYFSPHWPAEVTREAIKKGDVFRALFRVNAYNKLEAYCKIEGVQTDVLISSLLAQNRAVEGDIVAIKVDPPSLWIKMKGFTGTVDKAVCGSASTSNSGAGEMFLGSIKGKEKVDLECQMSCGMNNMTLLKKDGYSYRNVYCNGEVDCLEQIGPSDNGCVNGQYRIDLDSSKVDCSNMGNEVVNAVEKLCAFLSAFPSKRPTGRVVGIIEKSPRRDTVVGFLAVKHWMRGREGSKKDLKKNKQTLSTPSCKFFMLTPTDPKFSKMIVPSSSLPDCLKSRLEAADATVEMDLVAAQIVDWGEENNFPEAHVKHSFGRGGEIEAQIAAILFENAIDASEFSPEALSCLPQVPCEIPREEFANRKDLRNLCIFTIDPSTATDLDDALSVEKLSTGTFRVGVHIADVSYFVAPDTALDIDAQIRSTSIYLLKHKLPMLPSLLSEHLGSLNPGVDRLAFSMFWDIDPAGEVLDRWIGRTIMRSCCKLSYEHAQCIIDGLGAQGFGASVSDLPHLYGCFEWSDVSRSVKNLYEISKKLKERRFNGGALSLESPKVVFLFDEDGIPYDSVLCGRKESNFLVEEFMLLANQTAAEVINRAYPSSALLRKHPEPNLRKLREFEAFCSKNGLKLDISSSSQLHHSLECIRGELKNDSVLFDILMSYAARPMQLAAYFCSGVSKDTENAWGHYALAVPLYTHFTSPLRRYPDIVVHRTLAATLEAEDMYLRHRFSENINGKEVKNFRCFTSMFYVKDAVESLEAQEALSAAASKYRVPNTEMLMDVAAHCNERKLASRHVKDATDRLYMWALLRKKEVLCLEARVLGLGPKFMSIYIHKLAVERRIFYDEVDGLTVEWLEATTTLVLGRSVNKRHNRRGSPGKCRPLEEVVLIVSPCDCKLGLNSCEKKDNSSDNGSCESEGDASGLSQVTDVEPAVFPLTVRLLSTIPVALHAVGGVDGPVDIGARLYVGSYFGQVA